MLQGNEGFKYIKDAIDDALNMGDIVHATTQMQCFYHKEKKDVLVPTMKAALDQADRVITNSGFDREQDKSIRGFIMAKHDINAIIGLVESLQKSTSSIAAAVQAEIDGVVAGAQAPRTVAAAVEIESEAQSLQPWGVQPENPWPREEKRHPHDEMHRGRSVYL